MHRKIAFVLLLVFLVVCPVQALAVDPVPEDLKGDVYEPDSPLGDKPEVPDTVDVGNNLFDRLAAALVFAVAKGMEYLLGGTNLQEVIFNQTDVVSGRAYTGQTVGGIFTPAEWNNVINPLRLALSSVAWVFFVFSIAYYGWKMMMESTNPLKRSDWQERMYAYIAASMLLVTAHILFFLLANLNKHFVEGLYSYIRTLSIFEETFSLKETIFGDAREPDGSLTGSVLMDSFLYLAIVGMTIWLVIQYVFRKFMIAFLVVMAPLAAWAFARNRDGMAFKLWAAELTSQIFMQTAHALVLVLYFGFLSSSLGRGHLSGYVNSVLEPILLFVFSISTVIAAGALMWNSLRLAMSSRNPKMRYSAIKGLQYSAFGFFISMGAILIVNMLRGLIF